MKSMPLSKKIISICKNWKNSLDLKGISSLMQDHDGSMFLIYDHIYLSADMNMIVFVVKVESAPLCCSTLFLNISA